MGRLGDLQSLTVMRGGFNFAAAGLFRLVTMSIGFGLVIFLLFFPAARLAGQALGGRGSIRSAGDYQRRRPHRNWSGWFMAASSRSSICFF
jgi:hypothetical protein